MRTRILPTVFALAIGSLSAVTAQAQIINFEREGFKVTAGGQVNRGILVTDDGVNTDSFFVDNDNTSTRLRAMASYDFGPVLIGGQIEFEFEISSTASINQLNSDERRSLSNERKFELFAESKLGKIWVGQGDSASNGVSEIDLSGTTVIGYSSVSDLAGGILFRNGLGALTATTIGSVFSNLDGNSRIERVRYDTPSFKGLVLSGSAGQNNEEDLALRHKLAYGDFKIESGIAYSGSNTRDRIHGSVSALHEPTGISATFAAGRDDLDAGGPDPDFFYFKLGYQTKDLLPYGLSAISIDYYDGSDIGIAGSSAESVGIYAVQNIDRFNAELYAGYRHYELTAPGNSFQDIDAVLFGARIKF